MKTSSYGQLAGIEVDVAPLESERFGLPQAECQGDRPTGSVPPPLGSDEHLMALTDVQRHRRLSPALLRRVHQSRHVARNPLTLHRDLQRAMQNTMHAQDSRGRSAAGQHFRIQLLEVLGQELVESSLSDARKEVEPD